MWLLESLAKIAQPINKPSFNPKNPIEGMRVKFVASADEQIKQIKAAAEKGRWFGKQADGSYVLAMKNGNKALPLGGHTHFQVKDAANAVKFLETAKKAVQSGELNQVLSETALKRKPKSKEEVVQNDKSDKTQHDQKK